MVALYARDEALWRLAVDGEFGIRAQVARGITSDYLWLEQSLLYNNYVVSALLPFFTEAALAGRTETLKAEMASAENLMLAPVYLRFPDGKLPTPADSTGGFARAPNRGAFAAAYRLFPTPIGLEAAAKERSLSTLLDPPGEAGVARLPEVTSRHWESSRMMVLRKGQWQVYFHYGQVDASHAQAEALNYEVYYGGLDVTHDPGTVGYGSPLHRGYYTTGWAHNTVLVDGQGQAKWDPGKAIAWEPEAGRMAAAQPSYRPGVSVERELRVEGRSFRDDVMVRCAGDESHTIALAYHLQGRIDPPHGFAVEGNPPPYWEKARTANFRDTAEFRVWIGKQRFRLKVQVAGEFRVIHATTPDAPPGKRESLLVETKGKEARFGIELTDDAVPGGVI
jgi:hypothetical protein